MNVRALALVCVLVFAAATAACSGGGSDSVAGIGTITVSSIDVEDPAFAGSCVALTPGVPDTFPSYPTRFVITGGFFETVTGTTAIVRFTAVGGATPFYGGTESTVDVLGTVDSDTTICGTTPAVAICGAASVDATVEVILESGVRDDSTAGPAFTITFSAPTVASFTPALIPALTPVTFTITGAFLGNVGDVVTVRFASTEGTDPVFDSIFADGTTSSIDVVGTVTTAAGPPTFAGTIEGATPKSTNQVEDTDGNPFHTLSDDLEDVSVAVVLGSGSCSTPATGLTQFDRPEGDSMSPDPVPQTIATDFTITGSGTDEFAPVGGTVQVFFSAPGNPGSPALAFQLDPTTDLGTADWDVVNAVITDASTIVGKTPRVRADADFDPVVRIHFEDGTIAPVTATFTWTAPPRITSVVNTEAPTPNGVLWNVSSARFLGCRPTIANVNGANFQAGATLAIWDANQGSSRPIGSGTLASMIVTPPALISGTSPDDPNLANLDPDGDMAVETVWQVTNSGGDGQVSLPFSPVEFGTTTLADTSAFGTIGDGSTHNNTNIALDPTDTNNIAVVAANDPGVFTPFSSTDVHFTWSTDGGKSWTTTTLGSANDGLDPAALRNFAMCAYDHFGNLWVSYLVDDFTADTSSVVLLVSGDQGATFPLADASILATTAVGFAGNLDRPALAAGPDGAGDEGAAVAWVDQQNPAAIIVHARGRTASGLGAYGALSADTLISTAAADLDAKFMATPSIGPDGELYVSWITPSAVPGGTATILCDRDIDGLFGGTYAFTVGFDTVVATSNVNFDLSIPATTDLGAILAPNHASIWTGSQKGRLVMAYTDATPFDGVNPQTSYAVTRYSDDFGFTWSAPALITHAVDINDQFNPTIGTDETTGVLYVAWYDTQGDAGNALVRRWSAASDDGASWGESKDLHSQSFSTSTTPSSTPGADGEDTDLGYYDGLVARDGCVWASWGLGFFGRVVPVVGLYQQTPAIPQSP